MTVGKRNTRTNIRNITKNTIMDEAKLDRILARIKQELLKALQKHPNGFNSAHEGYAVILEELDELWEHVKSDTGKTAAAAEEARQIAAMGIRYILDLVPDA
jgi:hypothetical protein